MNYKLLRNNAVRVRAFILVLVSCSTTTLISCNSIKKYQAFARAGIEYNKALDELLKCTADVSIDGTSLELLENDKLGVSSLDSYLLRTKQDEEMLELVNLLREQVSLLQRYFQVLNSLASLDDEIPSQAGSEVTNLANGLTAIIGKFQQNPQFPNAQFNEGVGGLTTLIVSAKLKRVIREELEERKRLLQTQFLIHDLLVTSLTNFNVNDLRKLRSTKEGRLVVDPLLKDENVEDVDGWIENRGNIFSFWKLIFDLESVSSMPKDFTTAFEEIVTGEASLTRANLLESQFQYATSVYEGLCDYASYKQAYLLPTSTQTISRRIIHQED